MKNSVQSGLVWLAIVLGFNACATTYFVDAGNSSPAAPFKSWQTAATDIQSAIDAATDGDLILVTNGVYAAGGRVVYGTLTNRVVINKAVTMQSVNGPTNTTIQGYQIPSGATNYDSDVRCVYLTNNVVLDGFTITGGAARATIGSGGGTTTFYRTQLAGGGVFCESTNSVLTNCILAGNMCVSDFSLAGGGAVYGGTLNNCTLSNNIVRDYSVPGGAAYLSVLNNCLIVSNSASFGGGAAISTLNHCTVMGNIAPSFGSTSWGGGTYMCSANYCLIAGNFSATAGGGDCFGILNCCILSNNVCTQPWPGVNAQGGGSYQQNGSYIPMLNNCLIISNYCYGYGGGVYFNGSGPVLTNCTIVGNTATYQGGGVYGGTSKNSIMFGNYCTSVFSYTSNVYNAKLSNCWTSDPIFLNPASGNYHLQSNSPCINAGNNAYVSSTTDLDGNPRIVGGTVDIGAYEFQSPASVLSYAWAQQYGLPIDGSADFVDSDGDGMNNWQEWITGTNPTNPASVLKLVSPSNSVSGLTVTWQSVNTRTYYLQSSTNLAAQPAFTSIQSNIVGEAGTTSFTDTSATNSNSYFYRVGVQ